MKKLLFLIILTIMGCSSAEIEKTVEKTVFNYDVVDLKSEMSEKTWDLSWELPETKEIKEIRIYRKKEDGKRFIKKYILEKNEKSYSVKMRPFLNLKFKVVLVANDGSESEGRIVEVHGVHKSVVMDSYEGRKLQVYLPPSYKSNTDKRYPVVYAHDGQNMFDRITAPNGEWMVDEAMDNLISKGIIEEMIVVGIYNSSDRAFEYVPYQDDEVNGGEPSGAKAYADFVVGGIIPYIDGKYRTIDNRKSRAIMGSSYGGISALWTGLNYSETFSMIGAVSPSLWVGQGQIFKDIEALEKKDVKIWIDRGTLEWTDRERIIINLMTEKGYKFGKDIVYYEAKGREHNEEAWAERIPYILNYFAGIKEGKVIKIETQIELGVDYYGNISKIINVMVDYDNGMRKSAYLDAEFEVLNGAGEIKDKGMFEFLLKEDIEVLVKAYGMEEKIVVSYDEIQEAIKNIR